MQRQNLVKIHSFIPKLLSRNEILMLFKGRNSVMKRKLTLNNPKLDVVNIYAYAKFGKNPSICSQDTERKRNSDIIQVPERCNKLTKMDV